MKLYHYDLSITVSGGVGQQTFQAGPNGMARLFRVCIHCPAATTPSAKFDITDAAGYGLAGAPFAGDATIEEDTPCLGTNTLTITSDTDGVYSVRLYLED